MGLIGCFLAAWQFDCLAPVADPSVGWSVVWAGPGLVMVGLCGHTAINTELVIRGYLMPRWGVIGGPTYHLAPIACSLAC